MSNKFYDLTNTYEINTNNLSCITLCTPARVGSTSWFYALKKKYNITNHHYHDLNILKKNLNSFDINQSQIIIYGIRNPFEHILSNMFIHHNKNINTVKYNISSNINFFFDKDLLHKEKSEIIKIIKENIRKYDYIIDWSQDFFNIINYNFNKEFDKDKGFQILQHNNITYIFYRMDKIKSFKDEIKKKIKIELGHEFKSVDYLEGENVKYKHDIKELYEYIKNEIKFNENYIKKLKNSIIYKYFYTDSEIREMIEKYKETS